MVKSKICILKAEALFMRSVNLDYYIFESKTYINGGRGHYTNASLLSRKNDFFNYKVYIFFFLNGVFICTFPRFN